ncbi:MAG: transglutaminase-like domain-containing protein [Sphingomonas sp.]
MRLARRLLAGVLLCLCGAGAAAPADDPAWYVISTVDGTPIGRAFHDVVVKPNGRETVETREISLVERHHGAIQLSSRTVVTEDASGRTLSISISSRDGKSQVRTDARIDGAFAEIVRQTGSDRRITRIALPPGVRFDDGDGLLPAWDPVAKPQLEFTNLNVGAATVERVVLEPFPRTAPDPQGGIALLRRHYDGGELRSVAKLVLDRAHHIIATTQPMFGTGIIFRRTDRDTALRPYAPASIAFDLSIRSPFAVPPGALQGHIRYRFTFRDGVDFVPPRTPEQRVTADGDAVILDICATCGSSLSPALADGDAGLADARLPTAWLQSDDPQLISVAGPVSRMRVSDATKMTMLAKRARDLLPNVDYEGHYSALEAIRRHAGDCTEDAVVLAALGRSAGIPTRVVNGLVYVGVHYHGVRNAFLPHSWTLAWVDGRWRSFDMTLGSFDSTHIALTIGNGDARSVLAASELASLLQLETMAEVRARPTKP